ncbi:MAG: HAMP domain-containing histidine kinase [Deltaproteobacteria bacterium]|nr:HAMP domain-containing histidine kinase [Deltaproteobacteria bacterium]MBW2531904.1 HAMP domain-containing histidine kinase [Deltaproteobacteria bacterium]
MSRGSRHGRLFWRFFFHGLLTIVVVVAAVATTFVLLEGEPRMRQTLLRAAARLADSIEPGVASQDRLQAHLDDAAFVSENSFAVYTDDGTALARSGRSPPEPLDPAEASGITVDEVRHYHQHRRLAVRLPSADGRPPAYLLTDWSTVAGHGHLLWVLLVAVAVIGLLTLPLVRGIARPLERLAATARRLGEGDLAARSGIDRRDEVGTLARSLDEMAGQLERRVRGEKELLANVSHELRTPLSRISLALELCEEQDVSLADLRRHLSGIGGDVRELEQLVGDVLATSRLELAGGEIALHRGPTDVGELLAEAAQRFTERFPGRELARRVEERLPPADLDGALVRRVIDNLLDNAIKYSADDTPLEIEACRDGVQLVVEVRDRGSGVSAEDLPRLFEPFFRAERSRARSAGGSGLGLALCRRIVEAHEGQITAAPRDGGGMIFRFTLPA